jgi:hypothetical protein
MFSFWWTLCQCYQAYVTVKSVKINMNKAKPQSELFIEWNKAKLWTGKWVKIHIHIYFTFSILKVPLGFLWTASVILVPCLTLVHIETCAQETSLHVHIHFQSEFLSFYTYIVSRKDVIAHNRQLPIILHHFRQVFALQ